MVSILRSFSMRFKAKREPRAEESAPPAATFARPPPPPEINSRKQFLCKVILLDGADLNIALSRKAVGQEAYDKVFNHLDLDESDYFGLQYTDHYNVQHWLDPWKKIRKQIAVGRTCTFRFQVKFFSSEPANLRSEFTRYQFLLQLKNDIRTGKLQCPKEAVVPMAALQLQSECGDMNPEQHHAAFVSEFRFHPEQDEELELGVLDEWARLRGRTPAEAEQLYLDAAKRLQFYGVELYDVLAKDGNRYQLGLTPSGVIVLDGNTLIGLLFWHFMPQFSFHNRHITIVLEEHVNDEVQQHTFVFELTSQKASKHVWKRAVEYHTFYRMKRHRPHRKAADQILRFRSTFEHRGRTEFENVNNPLIRRDQRSISFTRKPSQRYGPRQSHLQRLREERERQNRDARADQLQQAAAAESTDASANSVSNAVSATNPATNIHAATPSTNSSTNFSNSSPAHPAALPSTPSSMTRPLPDAGAQLSAESAPRSRASSSGSADENSTPLIDAVGASADATKVEKKAATRTAPLSCSRIPRYGKGMQEIRLYENPPDALVEPATGRFPVCEPRHHCHRPKIVNGYPKILALSPAAPHAAVVQVTRGPAPFGRSHEIVMTQL